MNIIGFLKKYALQVAVALFLVIVAAVIWETFFSALRG